MRIAIAAVVILLAGWFGYDYYQTQQEEKAAIAAAEAAAAEAAAAEAEAAAAAEATAAAAAEAAAALEAAAQEAAAAAQAALDAAAAQLDPDNLIAKIEASSLSVVEKNLLKAIVEAARNSPELLQGAADQVAEKIGN
jgi:colicin import membrane protein